MTYRACPTCGGADLPHQCCFVDGSENCRDCGTPMPGIPSCSSPAEPSEREGALNLAKTWLEDYDGVIWHDDAHEVARALVEAEKRATAAESEVAALRGDSQMWESRFLESERLRKVDKVQAGREIEIEVSRVAALKNERDAALARATESESARSGLLDTIEKQAARIVDLRERLDDTWEDFQDATAAWTKAECDVRAITAERDAAIAKYEETLADLHKVSTMSGIAAHIAEAERRGEVRGLRRARDLEVSRWNEDTAQAKELQREIDRLDAEARKGGDRG